MNARANPIALARPQIRELQAYSAAEQVADTIRLNANESPRSSTSNTFRRPLNRYPEVRPAKLTAALATRFGCDASQLLATRGSSEAIDLLIRCFCRPGVDSIVTPTPAFSMYQHYAMIQGAETIGVATLESQDFAIDIDALLDRCQATTRLVFVCSPNNPTGTPLSRSSVESLLAARARTSIVVVDEAYIEFGRQESVVDLLNDNPNLVILRTLSKALGYAGARCGAAIASADIIRLLAAVQAPYALATPVVECVEDVLKESPAGDTVDLIRLIMEERERVFSALDALSIVDKVWQSDANFLLARFGNGDAVATHCEQHGILLRNFGNELPNCLRITIGTRRENDALLAALQRYRGQ